MTIEYRANKQNTLIAAYHGQCRVGYIALRPTARTPPAAHAKYNWELKLMLPEGGHAYGFAPTEADAKARLETAFTYWCECANLCDSAVGSTQGSGK